jgi:hypothetical protein
MDRNFVVDRPDALWNAHLTYMPTAEGFPNPELVLHVFSRLEECRLGSMNLASDGQVDIDSDDNHAAHPTADCH